MIELTQEFGFDAAHYLGEGAEENRRLHGHSFYVEVTLRGEPNRQDRLAARSGRGEGGAGGDPRRPRSSPAERDRRAGRADAGKSGALYFRAREEGAAGSRARAHPPPVLWPVLRVRGSLPFTRAMAEGRNAANGESCTQLGRNCEITPLPKSPDEAVLEAIPNPHRGQRLCRALHRAGIHHALPGDGPARFRAFRDRLLPGEIAASNPNR